jgi:dihydroneopterin aldolase
MTPAKTAVLKVQEFSLFVHLGCSAEERRSLQEIRISFEFRFSKLPEACFTDEIEGTICYGSVSENLRAFYSSAEFNTIERLALGGYEILAKTAAEIATKTSTAPSFKIRVHKLKPPVDSLLGGAVFEIESDTTE